MIVGFSFNVFWIGFSVCIQREMKWHHKTLNHTKPNQTKLFHSRIRCAFDFSFVAHSFKFKSINISHIGYSVGTHHQASIQSYFVNVHCCCCSMKWDRDVCVETSEFQAEVVCRFQWELSNTLQHVSSEIDECEWDDFRFFAHHFVFSDLFGMHYVKYGMINRNSCLIWQLFDLQKCTNSSMLFCPLIFPNSYDIYSIFYHSILSFQWRSKQTKKQNVVKIYTQFFHIIIILNIVLSIDIDGEGGKTQPHDLEWLSKMVFMLIELLFVCLIFTWIWK